MRIRQEVPVSWPQPVLELSCPAKGTILGTQCQRWMVGSEESSKQACLGAATSLDPLPQGLWKLEPLSIPSTLCGDPSKSVLHLILPLSKLQELGARRLSPLRVKGR